MGDNKIIREAEGKFETVIPDSMPEIFSDGISQLLIGTPVSKLTFHTLVAPASNPNELEQRQGVFRLTIPTPVLLELCRNVLLAAQHSTTTFTEGGKMIDAQVKKIMAGISISVLDRDDDDKSATVPKIAAN